jgi:ATP-dependent DNA helicase DinG
MSPAEFIDDPKWADFIPEMKEGAKKRHLPSHEDCSSLDPEKVSSHITVGGTLGSMPGYEERPGQIDMLKAIVRAFNSREHLMIEAGTGVGKSLAYLIPAIHWARTNDTPVLVSTATRNLQSQLISSDIPKALQTLGEGAADFKVALLKGRGNYLCLRALADFFAPGFWTMSREEQDEMPRFMAWLKSTKDGDLDGYDGLPRSLLTCPGEECGGRRCPYYSRCFVYRARKNAADAHLVVVNHALVLAEASAPGSGLLPAYGRLVLDEAHNLESIATEFLSFEFSKAALSRILNRLIRRGRGKRHGAGGVLASVERQLQKGVLAGGPISDRVGRLIKDASSLTVRIVDAADELSDVAEKLLRPSGRGRSPGATQSAVRYRVVASETGALERQHSLHGLFEPYAEGEWDESHFIAVQSRFESELAALVNLLHDLRDTLENSAPEGEMNYCGDLATQVAGIAESLVAFANEANFAIRGEKDTHAYWVERVHVEKRPSYIRLVAAPLSVADAMQTMLYDVKDSVVLSSATLRVGASFTYMARRLGCAERFRMLTAESPFDYLRQALVLAPDCLPDPSSDAAAYSESLAALMKDLFGATQGRALVLFTSYEMMNAVAAHARGTLAEGGIRLLVQGEGISRESMTRELREGGVSTVLFGAQSFWEGVDVAGEALSCVVLARLPFAQVGDPIIEARSEKIAREGGSSFRDYALPEAVIKFRQGFGRLIRTKRDRGVVVVTDPRLVTKSYGAVFRKSIPASVHTVTDIGDLLARVASFW